MKKSLVLLICIVFITITGCSGIFVLEKPSHNRKPYIEIVPDEEWEGFMVIDFRSSLAVLALKTEEGLINQDSVDNGEVLKLYKVKGTVYLFFPPEDLGNNIDLIAVDTESKVSMAMKYVFSQRAELALVSEVVKEDGDWQIELGTRGVIGTIFRIGEFKLMKLVDDHSPKIDVDL